MTTMTERSDRDGRVDVWEHRATMKFEVRSSDADELVLTGYASTFEPYEMYGGPAAGGWLEQLAGSAFDETLAEKPDLHLLINHEGMPLARTKSGTLQLSVDKRGLKVTARLDRSDPDVQRLEAKMRRGDMDEMSFAFRVKEQAWESAPGFDDDEYSLRTIKKVSLHKGDVSVVNFGANPTTHAEVKSVADALQVLADAEPAELLECRAQDDVLRKAQSTLAAIQNGGRDEKRSTAGAMSLRQALAAQGFAAEDGAVLSVAEARAIESGAA